MLQVLPRDFLTAQLAPSLPTGVSPPRRLHLLPDTLLPQRHPQEEDSLTAQLALSLPTGVSLPRRLHLLPDTLPPQRHPQEEDSSTAASAPSLPTGLNPPRRLHLLPGSHRQQRHPQEEDSSTALLAPSLPTGLNPLGRLHPSRLPPPHPLQASFWLVASQPNSNLPCMLMLSQVSSHCIACHFACIKAASIVMTLCQMQ